METCLFLLQYVSVRIGFQVTGKAEIYSFNRQGLTQVNIYTTP